LEYSISSPRLYSERVCKYASILAMAVRTAPGNSGRGVADMPVVREVIIASRSRGAQGRESGAHDADGSAVEGGA
jgi:hypothetical protein